MLFLLLWMAVPAVSGDPAWLVTLDRAEELRRAQRFDEAEPAYTQALQEARREDANDPAVAMVLNNTGFFLHQAGRTAEAERRYVSAYRWLFAHRAQYPAVIVRTVTNLGSLYAETGQMSKAESLLKQWVDSPELPDPADVARLRSALATVLVRLRKYAEAEPLFAAARTTLERGPSGDLQQESLALVIGNQAALYQETGRVAAAIESYDRALEILTALPGLFPISLVHTLMGAASTRLLNGQSTEALSLYRRALEIGDAKLGPDHPLLAAVHGHFAALLRQLSQRAEAKQHERRAQAIRRRSEQTNGAGYTVDVHALQGR